MAVCYGRYGGKCDFRITSIQARVSKYGKVILSIYSASVQPQALGPIFLARFREAGTGSQSGNVDLQRTGKKGLGRKMEGVWLGRRRERLVE